MRCVAKFCVKHPAYTMMPPLRTSCPFTLSYDGYTEDLVPFIAVERLSTRIVFRYSTPVYIISGNEVDRFIWILRSRGIVVPGQFVFKGADGRMHALVPPSFIAFAYKSRFGTMCRRLRL